MKKDKLLIINDITGYGRVSSFAMYPILSAYGIHPYFLPTALVSNTLDYGSAEILDTSAWMKRTIDKWKEYDFTFSCVSVGLLNSSEQVETIIELIEAQKPSFVLVDPIMADNGELYPDMYENVVECNRRMTGYADLLLPNYTEAVLLTGYDNDTDQLTDDQYDKLVDALYELGPKSIIIKGCKDENGRHFNLISKAPGTAIIKQYFDRTKQDFIGTGDVFSSVLLSELLSGADIETATKCSADFVLTVIHDNSDNEDHYDLVLEKSLSKLFSK